MTGVLAAGLTAVAGYAGAQVLVLGPSAPADTGASAVARATNQLGSLQGGPSRSVASGTVTPSVPAPVQQASPQVSYSQSAPVASSGAS